jgi:hypothetical protein
VTVGELHPAELRQHPLDGDEPNDFMYWSERQDAILAALERGARAEKALESVAKAHHGGSPHRGVCKVCAALAEAALS